MIPSQRHRMAFVPEREVLTRLQALQTALAEADIAVAWIQHATDLYYYTGSIQDAVLLIPAQGDPTYYARKSATRAKVESPLAPQPFPGLSALIDTAARLTGDAKLGVSFDITSAALYVRLAAKLSHDKLADLTLPLRGLRTVKSKWELEQIRQAVAQAERAFNAVPSLARVGLTELDVSADLESLLRRMGHGGSLRIRRIGQELTLLYAVAGNSACYPTNFDGPVGGEAPFPASAPGPGFKVLKSGETLMVDIVSSHNGYHADNARSFYFGEHIPAEVEQAHLFCLECLERLAQALIPGRRCAEVFREVNDWVQATGEPPGFMGCGENRVKFFGHGVGLELDEWPVIADRIDLPLKAGMVVAVEPKAFLPGIGGVGAENTYVITETGGQSLCASPMDLKKL